MQQMQDTFAAKLGVYLLLLDHDMRLKKSKLMLPSVDRFKHLWIFPLIESYALSGEKTSNLIALKDYMYWPIELQL